MNGSSIDARTLNAPSARFIELQRAATTRRVYASDVADWTRFLASQGPSRVMNEQGDSEHRLATATEADALA